MGTQLYDQICPSSNQKTQEGEQLKTSCNKGTDLALNTARLGEAFRFVRSSASTLCTAPTACLPIPYIMACSRMRAQVQVIHATLQHVCAFSYATLLPRCFQTQWRVRVEA